MRLALIAGWFLFMTSATFWLPAYSGTTGGEGPFLTTFYALVGAWTTAVVRERARSAADALVTVVPHLALLAIFGLVALVRTDQESGERGEPIYLYFGVTLLASWAVLLTSTAIASRTAWHRPAGIALGLVVAVMGFLLINTRFD